VVLEDEGMVDHRRNEKRLLAKLGILGIISSNALEIQDAAGRSPSQGAQKPDGTIVGQEDPGATNKLEIFTHSAGPILKD
jgi:hypothetical protein